VLPDIVEGAVRQNVLVMRTIDLIFLLNHLEKARTKKAYAPSFDFGPRLAQGNHGGPTTSFTPELSPALPKVSDSEALRHCVHPIVAFRTICVSVDRSVPAQLDKFVSKNEKKSE